MSPFDIPELLSLVACYLDRSSLYASIQVCRAWHGICFPLLWSSCLFTAEIYGAYHDVYDEHAPLIRHMQAKGRLIGGEMRYVAHRCPNLASLSLQHCQVTPMSLDTLFDGLPNVQSLTFDLCSGVNSSSIATRLARLPRLSKLEIVVHAQQRGNGDWREDDVALMLTNCVSLESLKIVGPDLSHVHLLSIQRQEKPLQLKHLHLVSTFISEKALKTLLLKSPNLSTLILLHNANKSSTVHLIGENGPMLEMLQLRNSKSVTMSAFDTLFKKCPLLKTLDISFTLIQDATLAGLAHHCPQLRVLDLTGCSRITHDAFQGMMRSLTQLNKLSLGGCTRLSIQAFSSTMDGALELWESRDTLVDLNISEVGIHQSDSLDHLLQHLRSLKRLRLLHMDEPMSNHPMMRQFLDTESSRFVTMTVPPIAIDTTQ